MNIRIHRGTHQIGGCVTEYEHEGWRLFVDYGEQLPGTPQTEELHVEGLTYGDLSKSALLITHYHGDHIGRITALPEALPMYIGSLAQKIQLALSNHLKWKVKEHETMIERLNNARLFEPGEKFSFGPFDIMPVTVDHSAFDAYAFKIETSGVKVFHTGDFRMHGFRSGKMPQMLEKYVGDINYLVCEATNARYSDKKNASEPEIQRIFEKRFRENKGNIVYLSSTNIDRLFSLYHAAVSAGRPFYVNKYQKHIMDLIVKEDSLWSKSPLYQYDTQYKPKELFQDNQEFKVNENFEDFLNLKGYVLIARQGEKFDKLIERLPGEKKKYLSMWEGYVKEGATYNQDLAKSLGDDYEYIHTSGHCDMDSLQKFCEWLQPQAIIPIHTDDPEGFAKHFSNQWPVVMLNDGDTFSPISSSTSDAVSADVLYVTAPGENTTIIENTTGEPVFELNRHRIGTFKSFEEATFALAHTSYKADSLLGYEVEEEEDMSPAIVHVYDAGMNLLATYTEGGHEPGGKNNPEACRFAPGEKVLAAFHSSYYTVVPATVIGPVTPDHYRAIFENDVLAQDFYDSFEDFQNQLWDWDWDSVAVHPLVKIECMGEKMYDAMPIPRVYLFPYREFNNL